MPMPGAGQEIGSSVQGSSGMSGPAMPQTDTTPAPIKMPTQGAGKSQLFSALKPSQLAGVYNK